jgi:hypothetical protein
MLREILELVRGLARTEANTHLDQLNALTSADTTKAGLEYQLMKYLMYAYDNPAGVNYPRGGQRNSRHAQAIDEAAQKPLLASEKETPPDVGDSPPG